MGMAIVLVWRFLVSGGLEWVEKYTLPDLLTRFYLGLRTVVAFNYLNM